MRKLDRHAQIRKFNVMLTAVSNLHVHHHSKDFSLERVSQHKHDAPKKVNVTNTIESKTFSLKQFILLLFSNHIYILLFDEYNCSLLKLILLTGARQHVE